MGARKSPELQQSIPLISSAGGAVVIRGMSSLRFPSDTALLREMCRGEIVTPAADALQAAWENAANVRGKFA